MRSVARLSVSTRTAALRLAVAGFALFVASSPVSAQRGIGGTDVPQDSSVETLFTEFLHYAKLGRFTAADAFARALLDHPDATPVKVLQLSDKDRLSIDTLQILVKNSTVGENAARVLELIEKGQMEQRKDVARILANVERLGGDPQQEYDATRHLRESGEYAIPAMVSTLLDDSNKRLWPRINTALPKIGKGAVNPLVVALRVRDESVRLNVIFALGEIGYPQAVPYLRQLTVDPAMPDRTKSAAAAAIGRIEAICGRSFTAPADVEFQALGELYYDEDPTVRADPRLDMANVWYWDDGQQTLRAVPVPTGIFGTVMAMRCASEALRLVPDKSESIALWLASNIRREGRLGMNVESGDPAEQGVSDDTRPANFPRALHFSQAAGPRYGHLVLDRAVDDQDTTVALGAIRALRLTAGPASLVGTEEYKQPLVQALQFSDVVVRIRAALALGNALPTSEFAGSQMVVPVLSEALAQTGRRRIVVVDADTANLNRVMDALRDDETDVIGEANFFQAMTRARKEFENVTAIFVASDIADPTLMEAMVRLRGEFNYSKTPVVVLRKGQQLDVAERATQNDAFAAEVTAAADGAALMARLDDINAATGQTPMDADLALSMALEAAHTLRAIAANGRTVFKFAAAEPALIGGLRSPDESLQTACASVLALAPTETAQRSIAHVALDAGNTETLRVAAFASLAESAKNHGGMMEDVQVAALVGIAQTDPNLTIRTAGSQALGAVNLANNKASEIIRGYYGG